MAEDTYRYEHGLTLREGVEPRADTGKPRIEVDLEQVEILAAQGLSLEQIAASVGINVKTLVDRRDRYVEYSEALKRGKARGIAAVSNALFTSATRGNVTAQIFFLKNRAPEEWKDRREHGVDMGAIQINIDSDDADL